MSAELIAKLTAKMRQIDGVGFGGTPTLTTQDVIGALAGTHRFGYLVVLAKYADDNSASQLLWRELALEIARDRQCSMERAMGVALACIFPVISPMRCTRCKGRKVIYPRVSGCTVQEAARECEACEGEGTTTLSERKRAAMAQVPETTWRQSWARYADRKEMFLHGVESEVLSALKYQLSDVA